ncbi:hypothetical protein EDD16DRAFT_1686223 [Pisolithus croceorrhizus]|nr:hypothetical protein EDD16DRAFT_1686223 [Pisolithus croceorrhizus]KAI6108180.1 hypothetical protein F5141DRAFT_1121270 [Pisolithus sp. B1]KAI6116832.1 hypothetical protein EV401DRAFT_1627021 [Pisolithus croceorrhizus]KAI6159804.1 hypothetical protein EDD17DRAFT_1609814 [Pisolithus thermaeus]
MNITPLPIGCLALFLPLRETTSPSFPADGIKEPNTVFDRTRMEPVGEGDRSISFSLLRSFEGSLDFADVESSGLGVELAGPPNSGNHSS